MRKLLLILLLMGMCNFPSFAANKDNDVISVASDYNPAQFWVCEFIAKNSHFFVVHLAKICSVAYHKVEEAGEEIEEVVLAVDGGTITKFRYQEGEYGGIGKYVGSLLSDDSQKEDAVGKSRSS